MQRLLDIHTYCRPHGGKTVNIFARRFLAPIPGAAIDEFGNWHVIRGDAPILWSAHVDTVHRRDGRQRTTVSPAGELRLAKRYRRNGNVLGADDGAGIWLLLELIDAGIPGHYVFHAGEECGCIGSSDLAAACPDWLASIQYAIAFDRAGTSDVITHQCGTRTCSDAFGRALAGKLTDAGLVYATSDRGVYTDTREYAHLVPECTNISVGYQHAHSSRETLDTRHLVKLRDAILAIDVARLPVDRTPGYDDTLWADWPDSWDALETPHADRDPAIDPADVEWLYPEYEELARVWRSYRT